MADHGNPPSPRARLPLVVGSAVVLIAGLVVAIIFVNVANSPSGPVAIDTRVTAAPATSPPNASTKASPSASPSTASQVSFADCTAHSFGAVLAAINSPSDVHVYSAPPSLQIDASKLYEATITTTRGSIVLCLQPQLAPQAVNNFVTLARNHFYDGIPFHRVCPNTADQSCGGTLSIIQGGDPNCIGNVKASTCGQGGPGYKFNDEPVRQQYVAGSVAMANSGPNTNGSQFFIDTGANQFPPSYDLFGKAASGLDVAQKIQQGDVIQSVTVSQEQ